jgi:hypothetical protein
MRVANVGHWPIPWYAMKQLCASVTWQGHFEDVRYTSMGKIILLRWVVLQCTVTFTGFMVNDNYYDHKHAYKKLQDRQTVSFKVGDLDGKGFSVWDQMLDWLKHANIPGYAKDMDLAVLSSRCVARLLLLLILERSLHVHIAYSFVPYCMYMALNSFLRCAVQCTSANRSLFTTRV